MTEPLSLLLGTTALTEGIKFLYNQAGEILKRWRERNKDVTKQPNPTEPVQVNLPPLVFEGQLSEPKIHFDQVEQLKNELNDLRNNLSKYVEEIEPVDVKNENLLKTIDELRQALQTVYQQRLTFKGEPQPPSGSKIVEGKFKSDNIAGKGGGVVVKKIEINADGKVTGEAEVKTVDKEGTAGGVIADEIKL